MLTGKGKQVAAKPDWKEQLAMPDQDVGWDAPSGLDWAESGNPEKQEVFTPSPHPSRRDHNGLTDDPQSKENDHHVSFAKSENENASTTIMTDYAYAAYCSDFAACYNDYAVYGDTSQYLDSDKYFDAWGCILEDDPITSLEVQQSIWEAAVGESRGAEKGQHHHTSTRSTDDGRQTHFCSQAKQAQEQCVQPKSQLVAYLYHRFGEDIRYENRCCCHEWLYDCVEEDRKATRTEYSLTGGGLPKDDCVLLPYPQEEMPGTEHADKPVLMVTTPEGEALFPHDMGDYPEPTISSERPIGGEMAAQVRDYVTPYEDEDGADI
ncbi:hypothetical protein N8I77_004904 [Diaporthe amygdali]|uniref:Uncharacterized protein n=1 Tax=Phomopsis amygdali TaxID=1214568 RepID=A0AAD9SN11_PHOAM|nr:hypothetical protein N8I77_004904 [Diaporthe amygdali]